MPYRNYNKNKERFPWLGQVIVKGKQKRKQFSSKQAAIKWEVEEKAKLLFHQEQQEEQIRTVFLHDWATAYLDYAKARFSKKTYEEKRFGFLVFYKFCGSLGLDIQVMTTDSITSKIALSFLQEQASLRSGNAANKQRKNLRAAWQWGFIFRGLPKDNPFDNVQRFAEVRDERTVPTINDFWQVFAAVEAFQDKLMLLFCLHTGARRDEVFRLLWKDIDFLRQRICLHTKKNELGEWKSAWLPMSEDLETMLRDHQRTTGLLRFVFLNQCDSDPQKWVPYQYRQHWLKKICEKAEVKQFGFHGIRHLFASILANKNVSLVEIQKMLRHGSITTTARYIHSLDAGNREVLDVLPGLERKEVKQNVL